MPALTIIKADEYIEKTISDIKDNITELIFLNDDIEITRYRMPKGLTGIFDALDTLAAIETYNIISGKIIITPFIGENKILEPGDTMVITQSNHSYPFQILEDTVFTCTANNSIFYIKKQQIEHLTTIMKKLQEIDGSTKEHCLRVQQLSINIARELNMDDAKLDDLFHAARFHDIGKIKIPIQILLKPSSLTKQERSIINTHPLESYKMITGVYGEAVSQMVLQHHERIDGSGYPYGLKDQKINFGAKVIAVADVYDALTAPRPYRPALKPKEAVEIILKETGNHYDINCVKALIKCLKKDNLI